MASTWSKATLLRRLEQAYEEQHGRTLFDDDGDITDGTTTISELVTYISRQIVVEAMTGRRTSDTPIHTQPVGSIDKAGGTTKRSKTASS